MQVNSLFILFFLTSAYAAEVFLDWGTSVGDQGTTTVNTGDTVTWVWTTTASHSVTSDTAGLFNSGVQSSGQFSFVFNTVGSFGYHCSIHNFMKGVIEVVDTTTPSPTEVPTEQPIMQPTVHPTVQPSEIPTVEPTVAPTSAVPGPVSPTQIPTVEPTVAPTSVLPATVSPTQIPTDAPTAPPTELPTEMPTEQPTEAPTFHLYKSLTNMCIISSGSDSPTAWSTTLTVRAMRAHSDVASFNTRGYCYECNSVEMCTYLGPTILLTPGDNFTLHLVNALGPNSEHGKRSTPSFYLPRGHEPERLSTCHH